MDKHTEQEANFLEKARLKSKEFYVKATQDAVEEAIAVAEQAREAARKAMDCLSRYAASGDGQEGKAVQEFSEQSAEYLRQSAQAMTEAAEAAHLAVSVTK
ncbi:hypothetical protein CE91St36_23240 [Christensenellaceae bacterium]|nr:hypothetical protein CE91St36_23240 [Christensenellaceae bacterium]BDF62172.1 hypothetical protein CE91St37_23220 [Christensenellaceae bacterium]